MSLNPINTLAASLAKTANETDTIKQNLSPDDGAAQLQVQFSEAVVVDGTLGATANKYLYATDSFVLDHRTLGDLDNSTLFLDGGYAGTALDQGQYQKLDLDTNPTASVVSDLSYANDDAALSITATAYYPFNGDADDAGPNGYDGVVTGATLTTDHLGTASNAYDFNGTTDGILVDNTDTFSTESVSGQETGPVDLFFKSDGTKMYILGTTTGDGIYQYSLGTAWDPTTSTYDSVFYSVGGSPQGLAFKSDGTKFYITDTGTDLVKQYSLGTAWDMSTASYDSVSLNVATEEGTASGIVFSSDGTKLYMCGSGTDGVYQYDLGTAWDLSTASYSSKSFYVGTMSPNPTGLQFNTDGTKLFVVDFAGFIVSYKLYTAWDITTAYGVIRKALGPTYTSTHGIYVRDNGIDFYIVDSGTDTVVRITAPSAYELYDGRFGTVPAGASPKLKRCGTFGLVIPGTDWYWLALNSDGSKMYVLALNTGTFIHEIDLATPYEIMTSTYSGVNKQLTEVSSGSGIFFKPDGTKMYINNRGDDKIYQYSMSPAWDITTLTYDSKQFATTNASDAWGLQILDNGTKLYLIDNGTNRILRYDLGTAWDISTAVFFQFISTSTYSGETTPTSLHVSSDGSTVWFGGQIRDVLVKLNLSTPWDLSTSSEDTTQYLNINNRETAHLCHIWKSDGTKVYALGTTMDAIYQYDLSSAWTFDMSGGFSVSGWVYPAGLGGNSAGRIIDMTLSTTINDGFALYMTAASAIGFGMSGHTSAITGTSTVTLNEWVHAVATVSGSGIVTLYLNGEKTGYTYGATFVESLQPGSLSTTIGNRNLGTDRGFDGVISDVLVVPVALSEAEVSNLYQYSAVHKLDKPLVTKTDILGESITGYEFIGKSDQLSAGTDYYGNHLTLASPKFAAGETYSVYMEFMISPEWTSLAQAGALIGAQFGTYMAIAVLADRTLQQREDDVAITTSALTAGKKYKLLADYSRDGANLTQNIYLDGTLAATQTVAWSDTYAVQNTYIGYEDRYHYRFNGVISKPRVFSRILSTEERESLFNGVLEVETLYSIDI